MYASSDQFYGTSYQEQPTTACILWSMSACCASSQTPTQSNLSDNSTFLSQRNRDVGISQQMRC